MIGRLAGLRGTTHYPTILGVEIHRHVTPREVEPGVCRYIVFGYALATVCLAT